MTWVLLTGVVIIGLIPARIAARKGGSFAAWWVFGIAAFIIALPAAVLRHNDYRDA